MASNTALKFCAKAARSGLVASFVAGAAIAGLAQPAAAETETLSLKYDIYTAGLRVATLKFNVEFAADSYIVSTKMKTKGLASVFLDSSFGASTVGRLAGNTPDAQRFVLETDTSRGERQSIVSWDASDVPQPELDFDIADYRIADVRANLAPGITDPLTALTAMVLAPSGEMCSGSDRVLNGKLMFDLSFNRLQRDDFNDNDAGVYRGEAHQCRIDYRPVAGLTNSAREEVEASGNGGLESYTVWLAPVSAPTLGRTLHVPVGVVGTVKGRQAVFYLNAATISGRPLNERSMASR